VVKWLLTNGADVDQMNVYGATPLYISAKNGHLEVMKLLLAIGKDVGQTNINGATLLYVAAREGKLDVVKYLLANGADVDQADKKGATPLYIAAQEGHLEVVKWLLANKANVDHADKSGAAPIFIAAQMGKLDVVKYLLANRANVGQADKNGATPLHIATQNGHLKVVKWLLNNGANIGQVDKNGFTLLHIAALQGHKKIVQWLVRRAITARNGNKKDMKRSQADALFTMVNLQNKWKLTPVGIAAEIGAKEIIDELLTLRDVALPSPVKPVSPYSPADRERPLSKGLLIIGPEHEYYSESLLKELIVIAEKGKVTLKVFGDGTAANSWPEFLNLPEEELGNVSLLHCHGARKGATHIVVFGPDADICTTEVAKELYIKGVRKMTFNACHIEAAAKLLVNRINLDPDWPKPLDETLLIMLVGEKKTTMVNNMMDIQLQMKDFADSNTSKKPSEIESQMEKMSPNTMHILTVEQGKIVKKRKKPEEIAKKNLSEEQAKIASGELLLMYSHHGKLAEIEKMQQEKSNLKKKGKFSPFNINYQAVNGTTALTMAADKGYLDMVEWLLKNGAKINQAMKDGAGPLYFAAYRGHVDVLKCLLQNGAKVDEEKNNGSTPLHIAAQKGHLKIVECLLQNGADINKANNRGFTPLPVAKKSGHQEVVKMLASHVPSKK